MPEAIDRNEVHRLISEENALLVEVMPRETYDEEHIAGAVSIPIKEMNGASTAHLEKNRPIIVYCWDMQ